MERKILSLINGIYKKSTANIMLNGEDWILSPKTMNKARLSTLITHINIVLEVLDHTMRQEKEIKGIEIGKKEIKLPVFSDDMIIYGEYPK